MIKTSLKMGESSWKYIADFNVALFIGGLVADKVVEKASWKILVKSVKDKLDDYLNKSEK